MDSGSRDHEQRGRAHCKAKSPNSPRPVPCARRSTLAPPANAAKIRQPSPAHLQVWRKSETHPWKSLYSKAQTDGFYCWFHDQDLKTAAESLNSAINTSKYHRAPIQSLFNKAGEETRASPQKTTVLLHKLLIGCYAKLLIGS